ncbi:MAG: 3-oxoacyl-ACP synthase III [Deltaproteobacteria bacterium]|nr:3-oxoacyl-ACP synthase III [Deltaproteobacteria bacterium]
MPPNEITSAALEERLAPVYERLKLPVGRLELMSGIHSRRFWDVGTRPSAAAAMAGRKALAASGLAAADIDCLLFTSVCRDMIEPASASFVHNLLGLKDDCLIFDLSNACLGFLNGMLVLANMIELGQVKHGLLVSGETAEDLVNSTIAALLADETLTRKGIKSSFASLTIGSGAVALVMSGADCIPGAHRLIGGSCRANTAHNDLCHGGSGSGVTLMATDSEELLRQGVETAHRTWLSFQQDLAWPAAEIDHFFCHQVGRAHTRLLMDTLGLDKTKNFESLQDLGNVGSVSAPITMALAVEQGVMRAGERAAILGIGSGINCLMLGIEW